MNSPIGKNVDVAMDVNSGPPSDDSSPLMPNVVNVCLSVLMRPLDPSCAHYWPVAVSVHDYQIIVSSVIEKIGVDTLEWVLGLCWRGGGALGCDGAFLLQAAQRMRISLIAEVMPGQKNDASAREHI